MLGFAALFGAGLWYAQVYAYYDRVDGLSAITAGGRSVPVRDYRGLDGTSSPLKLRGCFTVDPAALAGLPPAPDAVPLSTPGWFHCFDAPALGAALLAGRAQAVRAARDEPPGFDRIIVHFPDGRAYQWRQVRAGAGG
jgi:hypothetical protein